MKLSEAIALSKNIEVDVLNRLGMSDGGSDREFSKRKSSSRTFAVGVAKGAEEDEFQVVFRVEMRTGKAKQAIDELLDSYGGAKIGVKVLKTVASLSPTNWDVSNESNKGGKSVSRLRRPMRPLQIGASIGTSEASGGTLGAFVLDRNGNPAVLTSATVLFGGKLASGSIGEWVYQPSKNDVDLLKASHRIGNIQDFTELFSTGTNEVDCAIISLLPDIDFNAHVPPTAGKRFAGRSIKECIKPEAVFSTETGARVFKIGRSTGMTEGVVSAIHLDGISIKASGGGKRYTFNDLIEITSDKPFSRIGDGGALVFSQEPFGALGLLIASGVSQQEGESGDKKRYVAYACPLETVMKTLALKWLDSGN